MYYIQLSYLNAGNIIVRNSYLNFNNSTLKINGAKKATLSYEMYAGLL